GLARGKIWLEMSTTDPAEARRLAARVEERGAIAMDCPVSGGCHRAATGNISIFAGGSREAFERVLPVLAILGQRILHTGPVGSASMLKVLTNYLCTVHLAALAEALTVAKVSGLDLNTTYEGIRISSGNSFVHETESQVILNGSRDINFTMDLVIKDVGLFDELARAHGVPLELSPLVLGVFRDGARRYGERELSPNIIRRLEEACGVRLGWGVAMIAYVGYNAFSQVLAAQALHQLNGSISATSPTAVVLFALAAVALAALGYDKIHAAQRGFAYLMIVILTVFSVGA